MGVAPIQWRCWTCSLPGLRSESACWGTDGIHQAPSNAARMLRARLAAQRAVAPSPLERARSARSNSPRIA